MLVSGKVRDKTTYKTQTLMLGMLFLPFLIWDVGLFSGAMLLLVSGSCSVPLFLVGWISWDPGPQTRMAGMIFENTTSSFHQELQVPKTELRKNLIIWAISGGG